MLTSIHTAAAGSAIAVSSAWTPILPSPSGLIREAGPTTIIRATAMPSAMAAAQRSARGEDWRSRTYIHVTTTRRHT